MVDILTFNEFLELPIGSKLYCVCQGEVIPYEITSTTMQYDRVRSLQTLEGNFEKVQIYSGNFSKKTSIFIIENKNYCFEFNRAWYSTFDAESFGKTLMLQGKQIIREAAREMLGDSFISIDVKSSLKNEN